MKTLLPNSFFINLFLISKCFFQIHVEVAANVQKVDKHIGNFVIKMKLLGVLVSFHLLGFARGFRHLSTLLKKKHKHFRNSFFVEAALFYQIRNIVLKIAECWVLFKVKIAHTVILTNFRLSSNFSTRDCNNVASSVVKLTRAKSERLNAAIFSELISLIGSCRNTDFLKSSCAISSISSEKSFISSATTMGTPFIIATPISVAALCPTYPLTFARYKK